LVDRIAVNISINNISGFFFILFGFDWFLRIFFSQELVANLLKIFLNLLLVLNFLFIFLRVFLSGFQFSDYLLMLAGFCTDISIVGKRVVASMMFSEHQKGALRAPGYTKTI
jgi:hypothetical protein